jgi:hypothetical protein
MLLARRGRRRPTIWLRRRPARAAAKKIGTVVSHPPAPRFGVGERKVSVWPIGWRRRLVGTGAASGVGVVRCRVRDAVQHRWPRSQRRRAEQHQHERHDACLLRNDVERGALDQHQQNSGNSQDREHNAKSEMRSPLPTGDLPYDIRPPGEQRAKRERQDNHGHAPNSTALVESFE